MSVSNESPLNFINPEFGKEIVRKRGEKLFNIVFSESTEKIPQVHEIDQLANLLFEIAADSLLDEEVRKESKEHLVGLLSVVEKVENKTHTLDQKQKIEAKIRELAEKTGLIESKGRKRVQKTDEREEGLVLQQDVPDVDMMHSKPISSSDIGMRVQKRPRTEGLQAEPGSLQDVLMTESFAKVGEDTFGEPLTNWYEGSQKLQKEIARRKEDRTEVFFDDSGMNALQAREQSVVKDVKELIYILNEIASDTTALAEIRTESIHLLENMSKGISRKIKKEALGTKLSLDMQVTVNRLISEAALMAKTNKAKIELEAAKEECLKTSLVDLESQNVSILVSRVLDALREIGIPPPLDSTDRMVDGHPAGHIRRYYAVAKEKIDEVLKLYVEEIENKDPKMDQNIIKAKKILYNILDVEQKTIIEYEQKIPGEELDENGVGYAAYYNEEEAQMKMVGFLCFMCRKYVPSTQIPVIVEAMNLQEKFALNAAVNLVEALSMGRDKVQIMLSMLGIKEQGLSSADFQLIISKKIAEFFNGLKKWLLTNPVLRPFVSDLEKDATALAVRASKFFSEEETVPLDETHLVTTSWQTSDLRKQEDYRDWFILQSVLRSKLPSVDPETWQQLSLAILQAYAKAAPLGTVKQESRQQTTPLFQGVLKYHRGVNVPVHDYASEKFLQAVLQPTAGVKAVLIKGPLSKEVISRKYSLLGVDLEIDSIEKFEQRINDFIDKAKDGTFPKTDVLIDCTKLIYGKNPQEKALIFQNLESILLQKYKQRQIEFGMDPENRFGTTMSKLQVFAEAEYKGQRMLLIRPFALFSYICDRSSPDSLISTLATSGAVLTQDGAKRALLLLGLDLETILSECKVPLASLATGGESIPIVCKDFKTFLNQPVVEKFKELSKDSHASPCMQVLPKATVHLLEKLAQFFSQDGTECLVDKKFRDKKITDLLQISYFRMMNAMQEAILRKNDLILFSNQIELIHQEIQTILSIVNLYGPQEFSESILRNLTEGSGRVIPKSLERFSCAYPKTSGMHAVASAISAAEQQKVGGDLSIVVLKDSYYESQELLKSPKHPPVRILDGDVFNAKGIEGALPKDPHDTPIDVFVAEFHHNISLDRQVYRMENVCEQVKAMVNQNLVAEKFTVIIDTTMNLDQSGELQAFLSDPQIQELIITGKMNLVLAKSAQKFTMLGMDNYSGGIVVSINNDQYFSEFNKRMGDPDDQLDGLSYQGLTHLQKQEEDLSEYQKAIIENTKIFYRKLPEKMIFTEGTKNPIQISRLEDEQLVYLDLKFPGYEKTLDAFCEKFIQWARVHRLPLTNRPSFGFVTTNLLNIGGIKLRLSVGLDSREVVSKYAEFFMVVQAKIEEVTAMLSKNAEIKQKDQAFALAIQSL